MPLRDSNLGIGAGPGLTLTLLTESSDDIKQRLDKLRTNIDEQDSRWQASVRHVNDGLIDISKMLIDFQDDSRHDRALRELDHMRDSIRQIALLESNHKISERFE